MIIRLEIDRENDVARLTIQPGTTLTGTPSDLDTIKQLKKFIESSPDRTREIVIEGETTSMDIEQNQLTIKIY